MTPSLQTLKAMFADRPDVVALFDRRELDLQGLTDAELAKTHRVRQLYPRPINMYVTGRTGAGKSSLGNRFLDGNPLPSTGYQDCTAVVQYFRLASNLVYFDLPGSGSSDAFENINRAALLTPQLEDETPTGVVPLLDFTAALTSNRQPTPVDAVSFPLEEWEGEQCRQRYEPDVILYVIAPHAMWLSPDRSYLRALLKARKAAGRSANVVFALNIHRNPDGTSKATPQNLEDVQTKVAKLWEEFYPGTRPQMIEVNARSGAGMQALAEAMCRVLPPNKIGNMEQVLSSDLKVAAVAERSRRYRGLLVALASRLATFRVDATAGRDELLREAFTAICGYAVAVFHEEAAVLEAQRGLLEVAVAAAAEARQARAKAITVTQNDVVHREVQEQVTTGYIPKTEEVEVLEAVESLVTTEVKKLKSLGARMGIGVMEGLEHVLSSPFSVVQKIGGATRTENHEVRDRYRDSYSYTETVVRPTTTTVTRLEERIVGFEEQKELVTRLVPEVVSRQEQVGTEYLTGGTRVIEDVFALGLAAERVTAGANFEQRFAAAADDVRAEVRGLLAPHAQRIDTAASADQPAQKELRALLTRVFAMSAPPNDGTVFWAVTLPSVAAVRARLISRRLRLVGGDGRTLHMVATGRTGSGKTTLANRLLGIDYFLSHGGQDCTREVNHVRFPGRLLYSDLPGVCSDDLLENFNRAALGLPQVDDFPTVPTLTVATYSGDSPPNRRDHPVDQFASSHPPPDLLLYVVAADKQFTSADRRYLADLLARHRRVLYVLNVFATSIPTRANIHDVVGKIAAVHRSACGVPPTVVAVDCRSGDGLADLLAAARNILDADHGQLLTDLIADQERDTPAAFTADVCRYLIRVAASASAQPAGPPGSEHPIHRLAVGLWQTVNELRNCVNSGDAGGIAPYRPLVVEAVGDIGAPTTDAEDGLFDLVRKLSASIPDRLARQRNAARSQIAAALAELEAEVVRSKEEVTAAEQALSAVATDMPALRAELDKRDEEFARRKAELEATGRDIQMRGATLDHERRRFEQDLESLQDQFDEFNSTVGRLNAAGGLAPEGVREVDRVGTGLEREQDRLKRRIDAHNRANDRFLHEVRRHEANIDSYNDDIARHHRQVVEFNALVETFRARRADWHRTVQAHARRAASCQWAKDRCLGSFYPAEAELSRRLDEFHDRLRSTVRRVTMVQEADDPPNRFIRLEAGLRAAAADLLARVNELRGHYARLEIDRACDRLLVQHTMDHFDDKGDGGYRGSTYTQLAADAAALVFAAVHAGATGDSGLAALASLVERYRVAIGELPTTTLDAVTTHLESCPDLIRPEFELALAGLVFATDQAVVDQGLHTRLA